MLIYNVKYMQGTSQKTGRPYEGYALEGVDLISGELRNSRAFVNTGAYSRNNVAVGDVVEVLRSGEIAIVGKNILDVKLLEDALRSCHL